jgi:hypothetical protein
MPNQGGKGNPASHRMSNPKRKARRERSWARAQVKKAKNRAENEKRAADNRTLREQGLPAPHEAKQIKRREKRDALRAAGQLPPIGVSRKVWESQKRKEAA